MRDKRTSVTVDSKQALDLAVARYTSKGFTLVSRTETSAILQKTKKFNGIAALVGFLFCLVGLVGYLAAYSMTPNAEIVEISIVAS
jgi:hypothetical protein